MGKSIRSFTMRVPRSSTLLTLGLLAALMLGTTDFVRAQDDEGADPDLPEGEEGMDETVVDEDEYSGPPSHPLTDIPAPASDVETKFAFVNLTEPVFVPGVKNTLVAGFTSSEREYNVTHIMGSFNHPQDASYFVFNHSLKPVFMHAKPGAQYSFDYEVTAPLALEDQAWTLAVTIFYQDIDAEADEQNRVQRFASTFVNATVEIAPAPGKFDYQMIGSLITVVCLTLIFCSFNGSSSSSGSSAAGSPSWDEIAQPGSPAKRVGKGSNSRERRQNAKASK